MREYEFEKLCSHGKFSQFLVKYPLPLTIVSPGLSSGEDLVASLFHCYVLGHRLTNKIEHLPLSPLFLFFVPLCRIPFILCSHSGCVSSPHLYKMSSIAYNCLSCHYIHHKLLHTVKWLLWV